MRETIAIDFGTYPCKNILSNKLSLTIILKAITSGCGRPYVKVYKLEDKLESVCRLNQKQPPPNFNIVDIRNGATI